MTKICSICGLEKDENEFYNRSYISNKGNITKDCRCIKCNNKYRQIKRLETYEGAILASAKYRAKKKHLEFNLELSDIIIPEYCPILKVRLSHGERGNYRYTPSIDRLDNTKGYVKGNIRIISMQANKMKSDSTNEELRIFSNNILSYLNNDIVQTNVKALELENKESLS